MPVILSLWRMRQEDCKLEDNLCYIMRFCLKERKGEEGSRAKDGGDYIFQYSCLGKAWRKAFGSHMEM